MNKYVFRPEEKTGAGCARIFLYALLAFAMAMLIIGMAAKLGV